MPFRAPAWPGKGGKGRGGSRLGMKTTLPPAAPAPPDFITARPPLPPLSSFPSACLDTRPSPFSAPPPASPVQPSPPSFLPESSSALPVPPSGIPLTLGTPSPAVPTSDVPPRPWQGAGLGAMPPNWVYPPGGYMNILQQPQYLPQPRMQGENFYLVGQTMSFNRTTTSCELRQFNKGNLERHNTWSNHLYESYGVQYFALSSRGYLLSKLLASQLYQKAMRRLKWRHMSFFSDLS